MASLDQAVSARAVVVGSGVAGLTAALGIGECVVLTVEPEGGGSSRYAQGGVAAPLGPDDDPSVHAHDTVAVSGGAITGQDSMDSFLQSMLLSLPIAVLLTSLLVFITLFFIFRHFGRRMSSILKRSGRYALISMVPILLVVALVLCFHSFRN